MKQTTQQSSGGTTLKQKRRHSKSAMEFRDNLISDISASGQPKQRARLSTAIVLISSLLVWLALSFVMQAKLSYLAILTGAATGFIYGKRNPVKNTGIGVACIIFITCSIHVFICTMLAQSDNLGMCPGEIYKTFGITALAQDTLEHFAALDWIFLCMAAIMSGILARKFSKHQSQYPETDKGIPINRAHKSS